MHTLFCGFWADCLIRGTRNQHLYFSKCIPVNIYKLIPYCTPVPATSRDGNIKVTSWNTDYLCGSQRRNRWLSPITWTCCASPMYLYLPLDGCDLIGIIITLCTWNINRKHFTINHINTYEDVENQYHLTLQLFFSNYIPLKVEVTRTASIKRPLPPK